MGCESFAILDRPQMAMLHGTSIAGRTAGESLSFALSNEIIWFPANWEDHDATWKTTAFSALVYYPHEPWDEASSQRMAGRAKRIALSLFWQILARAASRMRSARSTNTLTGAKKAPVR
jgi:hypothetical protein